MINSKQKGSRGERLFSKLCRDEGFDNVHRTAQYRGNTGDAGDCEGLPNIHIEVKYTEHLQLSKAMAQSIRDSTANGKGHLPIVAHKKNREEWLITMRAEDWFKLYREYYSSYELDRLKAEQE